MEELKKCPFCGGEAELKPFTNVSWVKCLECKCETAPFGTATQAIKAWNNRKPTVEAKPVVHGEWEVVHGVMTPGGDPLLRCPFCRSEESHHMGGIEFPQHWSFCPNCGADMREDVQ